MNKAMLFDFTVDKENNRILVTRQFDALVDLVWAAWTEPDILAQWWAPKPYQAITKSMDFREGGRWHYYMLSPQGEKHWCLCDYETIRHEVYFAGLDAFCDENAVKNDTKPRTAWEVGFDDNGDHTIVNIVNQFEKLEDLETIIQMGFKEGFTAGMENLDDYIAAQFYLRKQKKPDNKARTSTYLNFPGNTEEAFNFYRSVFKTEFVGGIQRLSEAPENPEHPLSEDMKKLVLHVELPILGGHILMATDAPKEMGFTVTPGNNMHINLEPESRSETERLFNELSAGGKIEMPLQDMFWGAYFGHFTDKYGINWFVHHQEK